ncbi:MAG TPA: response regulator transcription factor [Gammaproteobacteria bacterium]|nr:response regulator transcription factor [Gammaproteobacteria bacterium]
MRIAILEDDRDQARLIQSWLQEEGHHVDIFHSGKDILHALRSESFDLLILDWLMPDMDGFEVLKWARQYYDWRVPIIFATRLDSEEDIVKALDAGADDYIEKPLRRRVLTARINALTRRLDQSLLRNTDILDFSPYRIDLVSRIIYLHDQPLELTQKEYDLSVFLFRNSSRALSRGHILDSVWGTTPDLNTRTVDTHISRLRKKLALNKENGWLLTSIYQHGYRLDPSRSTRKAAAVENNVSAQFG